MSADNFFTADARVDPKGRITIPKDVRAALGAARGGRVTFIVENDGIRVVHAAVNELARLQARLRGVAERAGLPDEESVSEWTVARRKEDAP